MIVHGERDRLVPFANARYLRDRLTRAQGVELVPIRAGGHFIPRDHADLVRQALELCRAQ